MTPASTSNTVKQIGKLIVAGRMAYRPNQVISLQMITAETSVSRAMARDALQVLHQKRLVKLRPRVGATVRPMDEWDVFDPDVIAWRLEIAPRFPMRSLTELRLAVEPTAAFFAAQRASAEVCRDLVGLSQQLRELGLDKAFEDTGEAGKAHREKYRRVDEEFHQALLKGSGNEMFHALADPVKLALSYRIEQDLDIELDWPDSTSPRTSGVGGNKRFPRRPEPFSLWLHHGLAHAVEQGSPEAAETFSLAILAEIRTDPLPDPLRQALRRALGLLDARGMEDKAWKHFENAVTAII